MQSSKFKTNRNRKNVNLLLINIVFKTIMFLKMILTLRHGAFA